MEQRATAVFDVPTKTLIVAGELLPATPTIHDLLADLLFNDHEYEFQVQNLNNVLSYTLTVKAAAQAAPKPAKAPKAPKEPSGSVELDVQNSEDTKKKLDEATRKARDAAK